MSNEVIQVNDVSRKLHQEYALLLEKLHMLQSAWHKATIRKGVLEASFASTASYGDVLEPIRQRLSELQSEHAVLSQQNVFLHSQVKNAKELYKRACEESSSLSSTVCSEKELLEEEYLQVMRLIDQFDPELQEDAPLVKAALAEQRVELRVLQDALDVVKQSMESDSIGEVLKSSSIFFASSSPTVEVPIEDISLPVTRGRLRLLTGPSGDGLQQLRDRHRVSVFIVSSNDQVSVRVRGHRSGVENCVSDIRRILSL
ncbi:uncharacterized protein TM35_000071640 [Trypanosoma theileri]|uniref:K Homology domain-containing protein n=1 Tax=Trypanosoma theileri TaxID=67003 RepID=A0A1X0P2X1_9TRYP|nr:uncharacterized protein TM35_000071640 [Trypanosoma theileri]ORC90740.1 hypothetical protein TM35_000071640 [Trypanosoma theileri]